MKKRVFKVAAVLVFVVFAGVFVFGGRVFTREHSVENYHEWISDTYDFRFGRSKPFAPSNANTFSGRFINGKDFISSERCASCHKDVHPQWRESAHSLAFTEPFYQKNVKDLTNQKNIAFTRHCESCHNPAALFSGALTDKPQFAERPFDNEGVSCIACHSIQSVNGRGIGGYVMGQPALLERADGKKIVNATDDEITDDIESHKRAMMREVLKKPEFCGACHKSQVPKELNGYKFLRAFAVADEYQQSSFSKEVPHPFYVRDKETCNSCHMKKDPAPNFDVSAKNGVISSHRFAAANSALPLVYKNKTQFEQVEKFLKDDKIGVDIFALSKRNKGSRTEKLYAPIDRTDVDIRGGDQVTADVVITNKNIGHSFPPELRDFYEAYIEFTVKDHDGKVLLKSGFIQPDGNLDPSSHNYKTYLVKPDGSFNDIHHIWQTRVVAYNNAIPSGRSDLARYRFSVPENYRGQLKLSAAMKYRRFTRAFSDYVVGKSLDFPIITMAENTRTLEVGETTPKSEPKTGAMPDWRRWNNYGIALLDTRQFSQSADAFDEVIAKSTDYKAFAFTNKALAAIELGNWKEAEDLVKKTLAMDPTNFRAIYQMGRVNRVNGRLDEAEANFAQVLQKYPNDRLTLQQLGELAKIKSDSQSEESRKEILQQAAGYFKRVVDIDPEDRGAVYNLMLIYQKLGMQKESAEMATSFKQLKDDPQTTTLANEFLKKHPELGTESVPFHVHFMKPYDALLEKQNYLAGVPLDFSVPIFSPVAN